MIELRGIVKRFGAVVANDGVSFSIPRGRIHGVVGENGAGKSTIMKVLYGDYEPDEGEIALDGKPVQIRSPRQALSLGIGMVYQHFMLVPTLPVWRNVILGRESAWLDPAALKADIDRCQKGFGFSLDLDAVVETLPVGQQQQVELLKLLYRESQVLILDEPTAVLTPQEVDTLFERLQGLRDQGKTIVLITHKLREVLRFTENVTVMRGGKVVGTWPTAELDAERLAETIIGRRRQELPVRSASPAQAEPVLAVKGLSLTRGKQRRLHDLDFEVRPGEILGVAGVEGNGQHELIEVLAGIETGYTGEVSLMGRPLGQQSTYAWKQHGLAVVPPDRHREAVLLGASAGENYLLGHHREARFRSRWGLSPEKTAEATRAAMTAYDVRPAHPETPIGKFSGGNQQKLVVARELQGEVKLLLAAHPTRGVDIGAIEFLHSRFLELRSRGAAIVLVSSELDELLALSDRIIVLFGGEIRGRAVRGSVDERQLGLWMTGAGA